MLVGDSFNLGPESYLKKVAEKHRDGMAGNLGEEPLEIGDV